MFIRVLDIEYEKDEEVRIFGEFIRLFYYGVGRNGGG